jgi:ABC-type Fe3+ transport system permease subunit
MATGTVGIERLMSRPGDAGFGQAMALSCVLVALCGGLLWLLDRAGRGGGLRLGL